MSSDQLPCLLQVWVVLLMLLLGNEVPRVIPLKSLSLLPREELSLIHNPWLPCTKLIMLTEDMKLWHGLVIAVVSLVLQACLFTAINYLLSRHMAKKNEQLLKRARLQDHRPSPAQHHSPAAQKMETQAERSIPASEPHYRNDNDTSSDSSDTSDSASSSPPTCQTTKDVNYTQVVFSATGGRKNESALDYENIQEAMDYVNVHPRSHKHNSLIPVNPAVSEPVEYSVVAM